jgi:uncharacterized protein (TIGR02145 family)
VEAAGGIATAGSKLKSTSGWNDYDGVSGNGTDTYGFSALPGGYRYSGGYFYNAGDYSYWWTATEDGSEDAYSRGMGYDDDNGAGDRVSDEHASDKGSAFSVRCIKD